MSKISFPNTKKFATKDCKLTLADYKEVLSTLFKQVDFGKRWFNIECSKQYWNDIKPIFNYLEEQKKNNRNWNQLEDKENDVYIPLLNAFIKEVKQSTQQDSSVPRKMVEYLLGEFDFYKVISIDMKKITRIQSYNLHGKLNQSTKTTSPKIKIPAVSLPTRIVSLEFKPESSNTVELYMDGGWQFNFRIHNASTKVETSLKFDIQIVGMPTTIISIDCKWN